MDKSIGAVKGYVTINELIDLLQNLDEKEKEGKAYIEYVYYIEGNPFMNRTSITFHRCVNRQIEPIYL